MVMNTNQSDATEILTAEQKWEQLNFPEKEFCALKEGQNLVLKATEHFPERVLANVVYSTLDNLIKILTDKFKEVEKKFNDLAQEWNETEDKLKLVAKLHIFKSYVLQAVALGNYSPIFADLVQKEKQIETIYKENYQIRLKLVEKAESLRDSTDWKITTDEFKQILEDIKSAPLVEKHKNDELWDRLIKAKEHFFQRKRVHQEELEAEMMNNLDLKLEICEKAEMLAKSDDWRTATDALKDLMEQWKSIGRLLSVEKNDELWHRFLNAQNNFFERKKKYFSEIFAEQDLNYQKKLAIVEKAEALQNSEDWKETTEQFNTLNEEWKAIGKVPREKIDEIWERFRNAKDKFFDAKRKNYQELKVNLEDNYARKSAIVDRVENIKNSENWRDTTFEFNELMNEWKSIGPIPREYGDQLWEKFIAARKHFFNRKDAHREKRNKDFENRIHSRLQQTKDFLAKIEDEYKDDLAKIEEFKESINNISGEGAKDLELKNHLTSLVQNLERKLPNKSKKIAEVKNQYEELLEKTNNSYK